MDETLIPFDIETSRVIELLAKQIYQSPFALLRGERTWHFSTPYGRGFQIDGNFSSPDRRQELSTIG